MAIFYNLIYIILAIFYLPYFLFRLSRDKRYGEGFFMRLGILPKEKLASLSGKKVIWLHTVSVGEIISAGSLIRDLLKEYPDYQLVISTVTQTGNRVARKMLSGNYTVIYFPFDLSWIVRKVIGKINPVLFLAFETEIWPNFTTCLFRRKIPLALVNGRISAASFRGYKKIKFILKGVLTKFDLFCMRTALDAERIIALGALRDKVKVTGNMKFDQQIELKEGVSEEISKVKSCLQLDDKTELFIAGSTHPGEEEIILDVFRMVKKKFPNLKLLIAPRHPQRTPQIEKLVSRYGVKPVRVSELSTDEGPSYAKASSFAKASEDRSEGRSEGRRRTTDDESVFILDTIGQLRAIYGLATVVFVGGSLIPHGGHNPIEAAILAKPILFGRYRFNFKEITDILLDRRAAILVNNREELKDNLLRLLASPSERAKIGAQAKESIKISRGATKRCINLIKEIFDKKEIIE